MTLQVEIGQKLNNNMVQVNTFEVQQGTQNKFAPKSYAVNEDKKDAFIKELKNNNLVTTKMTMPGMLLGGILGSIGGWKWTTNASWKPWAALMSFVGGGVLGSAPALIHDKISNNNTIKKYNTQRVSPPLNNKT